MVLLVVIMMLATVMVIVVVILALVVMVECLVILTFRGAIIQSVPPTRSHSTKDKAVVDRIGIHPRTARFHSLPFGVWHVQQLNGETLSTRIAFDETVCVKT